MDVRQTADSMNLISFLYMTNQDRGACLQASLGAPPFSVTEISPKTEDITAETSNKNTGCYAECPHMVDPHQPAAEQGARSRQISSLLPYSALGI